MNISELVARAIIQMLDESDGAAEIQRNELASSMGCVPSQINYVITSRFTPELGYSVESRRGGGGYIRITRVRADSPEAAMNILSSIGSALDQRTANVLIRSIAASGMISEKSSELMWAACCDNTLKECSIPLRDKLRASIFKQMLLKAISD